LEIVRTLMSPNSRLGDNDRRHMIYRESACFGAAATE
jgi:hypothetical protein